MQAILDVLDNFLVTKAVLSGKARRTDSVDQRALLNALPDFFLDVLARLGRSKEFVVTGSIGDGNIARVPWVGIFNEKITVSAQRGYYIVLLFSEDMSGCYLSLNQGVTEMEQRYSRKLAILKMKEAAERVQSHLKDAHPEAVRGPIDLHSTGDLGRGYDAGAIESYHYLRRSLPAPPEVEEHFKVLLAHYDRLINAFGKDLQVIAPVTELEFQDAVFEKASSSAKLDAGSSSVIGGAPIPPQAGTPGKMEYVRDPAVAASAIRFAKFKCELDALHWTFVSRTKKKPYVEAHHLIPMSRQGDFQFSLDVEANVVSLCATCHRLLHHGLKEERRDSLERLLAARSKALKAREIHISKSALLAMYTARSELIEQ